MAEAPPISEKRAGEMPPPLAGTFTATTQPGLQQPGPSTSTAVVPQPIILYQTSPSTYPTYNHKATTTLGTMQIVIGMLMIILQAVAMILGCFLSIAGTGFWIAVFVCTVYSKK